MKITMVMVALVLAHVGACRAQGSDQYKDAQPAPTNAPGLQFPRILPDHRVMFQAKAPGAGKVQIDLGRLYDMQRDSQGVWTVTTDPQGPGFHYYSLVIDGLAVADPASQAFYGMGRMASGIEIPDEREDYCALKNVPHGELRIVQYYSTVLNRWRQCYVYTPAGYETHLTDRYPVLYILHGGGEDERGWATQGKANLILDNLIAERGVKPMLVVMPDGNVGVPGFGENSLKVFEGELKQCIIPFVERTFRTAPGSGSRALAGLSMGGIQTLYVGIHNTDLFSCLGVFSSGWILPMQGSIADAEYAFMKEHADAISRNIRLFWISMGGKEDIAYKNCQAMLSKFDAMNVRYTYYEFPGGHTWPVWRNDLYTVAPMLFR